MPSGISVGHGRSGAYCLRPVATLPPLLTHRHTDPSDLSWATRTARSRTKRACYDASCRCRVSSVRARTPTARYEGPATTSGQPESRPARRRRRDLDTSPPPRCSIRDRRLGDRVTRTPIVETKPAPVEAKRGPRRETKSWRDFYLRRPILPTPTRPTP